MARYAFDQSRSERQAKSFVVSDVNDFGPHPNPDWKEGMDPAQKTIWPTNIHGWFVPLGAMAEQPVLITIATDAKGENNADQIWWSRPVLVQDAAQQAKFVEFTEKGEVPEEQ